MNQDSNEFTRSHIVIQQGTEIAQYRIIEKIGAGGMGEVYLAEDTKLKRRVALKFLPVHLAAKEDVRTRFVREAQTVAKLNHPNIVGIHDVSEFNGRPYFVMEHIGGQSLHEFAHDKQLPLDLVVEYAIQICQGLGEAHRAGIVHRDIKAANIALDKQGRIRLLDFGLAAIEGDDKLTRTGSTLGTVSYMSPEQVSGREIDLRSDLFSLGVVLYELIAGRTPFRRDSEGATLQAIIQDNPEPLSRYKSDVPDKLQEIVGKLLDKDKELRYQSAEGVIADLKRLLYDSQQGGSTAGVRVGAKKSRNGLSAGIAVAVIAVVVAVYMFIGRTPEQVTNNQSSSIPMIAVLPFENLGAAEDDYFADGMTDEINSRLVGISGLGVISRTSSMKYKGSDKNLADIASGLNVDFILTGSVRWSKVGDNAKVRISPQLVRVSDDRPLWSDIYERDLMEVFAVQAEIASQIVEQMGLTLVEGERQELARPPTDNSDAYSYYLKGLDALLTLRVNFVNPRGLQNAGADLDRAVELDPNFALAHAARSIYYSMTGFFSEENEDRRIALESARRALELEPDLPQAHQAMGVYHNFIETDYTRALEEFNLAKRELHSDPDLLGSIALVQFRMGDFNDAIANFRKAAELDPINPSRHWQLGICLKSNLQFEEAGRAFDRALILDPTTVFAHMQRVGLYASMYGQWDKIKPVIDEALESVDSLNFFTVLSVYIDSLPEIDWSKMVSAFRDSGQSKTPDLDDYYSSLAMAYYWHDDLVSARVYADSARMELERKFEKNPEDVHGYSELGIAYAVLGDCEKAVENGQKGKEKLSIEECHW